MFFFKSRIVVRITNTFIILEQKLNMKKKNVAKFVIKVKSTLTIVNITNFVRF